MSARSIVFCTDFGLVDEFVGVCHGVMARIAPDARVIDLTHAVPRQDVTKGAMVLSRAAPFMPADAVFCGVIDPGVGSERRPIAVEAASGAMVVGPDNGLLSALWDVLGGAVGAVEIASAGVVLEPLSRTFHGRDMFAPAAAHLAAGMPLGEVGPAIAIDGLATLELPAPMVAPGRVGSRVTGIDGFGNVQLNVTREHLAAAGIGPRISLGGEEVPFVGIFSDLPERGLGLMVDSQGYVAIVVNRGSAAEALQLTEGAMIVLEAAPGPGAGGAGRHLQPVM
jgi:S-adenosylmethionine hydrolase